MKKLVYSVTAQDGSFGFWEISPIPRSDFAMVSFLNASKVCKQAFPMLKTRIQPMIEKARSTELSVLLVQENQQ